MPLNVSPQPHAEAVAGRGIGSVVEAYPEHVAVACEDIFHAGATALSRGLDFQPVPQNYYEDLDSRFDLAPEFLQKLQENPMLLAAYMSKEKEKDEAINGEAGPDYDEPA